MNLGLEFVVALLSAVAVGLWIYGDAINRKLSTALYWSAAGFLFGLAGFIAYFLWVIRPNKRGGPKA